MCGLRLNCAPACLDERGYSRTVQIAALDALGCEVEHNFLNDKIKSVTAYFGLLSAVLDPPPSAESPDPVK